MRVPRCDSIFSVQPQFSLYTYAPGATLTTCRCSISCVLRETTYRSSIYLVSIDLIFVQVLQLPKLPNLAAAAGGLCRREHAAVPEMGHVVL